MWPCLGDNELALTRPSVARLDTVTQVSLASFARIQESVKTKHPQLLYESKLYKILQGGSACPLPPHKKHSARGGLVSSDGALIAKTPNPTLDFALVTRNPRAPRSPPPAAPRQRPISLRRDFRTFRA